jgi:hypothetical protein
MLDMKNGKIEWRSLASLKTSVILTFVVLWNAGFLTGLYLNGGFGPLARSRAAAIAVAATCAATCGFTLALALSRGVQDALLAESRRDDFRRGDFVFLALLTGGLCVAILMAT